MTTQPKINRKLRLCGDGVKYQGPNRPNVTFTEPILRYLHDQQHASFEEIMANVPSHYGKDDPRIAKIYNKEAGMKGDAYTLYMQDLLDQLVDREVVKLNGSGYQLGPAFKTGVPLPLFKSGDAGIVYPREQREILYRGRQTSIEVRALVKELRPDGKGIRLLRPDHVEHLAIGMRAFGYDVRFPIIMDQEGRILDGRHRQAAAKKAGVECAMRIVHVASDLEALQYAFNANVAAGFTKHELDRIAKFIGAAEASIEAIGKIIGNEGKRTMIKAELVQDSSRSNRAIAKKLGVDHHTVAEVRAVYRDTSTGEIPHSEFRTGADGRRRPATRRIDPEDDRCQTSAAQVLRIYKSAAQPLTAAQVSEQLPAVNPHTVATAISELQNSGYLQSTGPVKNQFDRRSINAFRFNADHAERHAAAAERASTKAERAKDKDNTKVNKILALLAECSPEECAQLEAAGVCRKICRR